MNTKSQFTATYNKGFGMTFANGWTISVQWGAGNYCDNRNASNNPYIMDLKTPYVKSTTAEIAIWHAEDKKDYDFGYDNVKGYCDANEVAEWIDKVSKW